MMAVSFSFGVNVNQKLRLVVVADGCDPRVLVSALIAAGIDPKNVHLSKDADPSADELGAVRDLPVGRLYVGPESVAPLPRWSMDSLVP